MVTAAVSGALAVGSEIYKLLKQRAKDKRGMTASKLIKKQQDEADRWYNMRMNQDYTLRTDAQNAINRQRELLDEQYKRAKATNVVAGGSESSVALQKELANKSLADTTADVAAAGAADKDRAESMYRSQKATLNQQAIQASQQEDAQLAQATSQVVNAGLGLVGSEIAGNAENEILNLKKKA